MNQIQDECKQSYGSSGWNVETLFELGDAFEYGFEAGREINDKITGRLCAFPIDAGILAQVIREAGPGKHLEIGSLYGGSAILAALVKDKYGLGGKIVCVDPMAGYYGKSDPLLPKMFPGEKHFIENVQNFRMHKRIELVKEHSNPLPVEVAYQRFVSAYLDGDHSKEGLLADWENVKGLVSKYIMFDNYDGMYPEIVDAFREIANDPEWECVLLMGISVVMRRSNA